MCVGLAQGGTAIPARSTQRRASTDRAPLSRERISRAGLELADREGIDALSMRRLADELGAGTMTLYGHFAKKRELLDAVIETAVSEQELPRFEGSWRDQLRQLGDYNRELFSRHPIVLEIWARQPVLAEGTLHGVEAGLRILEDAGFESGEAVKALRMLIVYTFGFEMFSPARSSPEARAKAGAALGSLPPETHPRLSRSAGAFAAAMGSEESYEYGLDRLLDALEARLP